MTFSVRVRHLLGLAALALIPLQCSHFDSSTDIGGGLLDDVDPTIANPGAVLSYGKAEAPVVGIMSSRDSGNISATARSPYIAAGALGDEFAYAYFEFDTVVSLLNVRRVTRAVIRLEPASTNINVSPTPLVYAVDTCAAKDSAGVLPAADIRRTYATVAFAKNASGVYSLDSVVVGAADLEIEVRRYYPGGTFTDTVGKGIIRSGDTVVVDTSWKALTVSAWSLASRDSVSDTALALRVRTLTRDSTLLITRQGPGDTLLRDTVCHAHVEVAETLVTVRSVAKHDTAFDTIVTLPGARIQRTMVDSTRIDRVLTDTLVVVRRHRYDSLMIRSVVQRTTHVYRLILPDSRDTLARALVFADTLFRDSLVDSVTVRDTLELDSSGMYADLRYTARGVLPVDSTHVRLRRPFFSLKPVVPGQQGLVRLWKPYIMLSHTDTAGQGTATTRVDCNYADYHVYEKNAAGRDTVAFCSAGSRRFCRIALDMRALWQTVRDSAARCDLHTVLGAVATVPIANRWRESAVTVDTILYALTPDTALPTALAVRGISADTAGLVRLDLQRDLDALWDGGRVLGDSAYLHVWLPQTRDREWSTIEFAPAESERVLRVEFFLTAPGGR